MGFVLGGRAGERAALILQWLFDKTLRWRFGVVTSEERMFVFQQLLFIGSQERIVGLLSQSPIPNALRVLSTR